MKLTGSSENLLFVKLGNTAFFVIFMLTAIAVSTPLWSQAPGVPTGLTAIAGDMNVTLSWTAPSGATTYNVYQGTSANEESASPVLAGITGTPFSVAGLNEGTTYYFKVAAVNSSGASALSNEASATPEPLTSGTNAAASFSIFPPVQAANPVPAGFNTQPAAGTNITENSWLADGGFSPYDARISFTAQSGSATSFVVQFPNPGADFYQSIATGYFAGATALTYRFSGGAWSLLRTDTVTGYTADGEDETAANNTITFADSGPAVQAGDIVWLDLDNQASLPGLALLDPRFTVYYLNWGAETLNGDTRTATIPYTLSTDVPTSDAGGLSLELTDTNTESNGIWQYMQGAFVGPAYEEFQPGHSYEVDVWLKQSGIGDGSVTFSITGIGVSHTFSGVTGTWQHFIWTFPAVPGLPANSVQPSAHLDFNAPGTMWVDNFQLYDAGWAPNTVSPQAMQAWQSYHPGTVRIWSNFGNAASNYSYFSLNSWLTPEIKTRNTPGIGNEYELPAELEHLPDALANVKTIGANPWFIVNMALSPTEWGELIDYLAAPAGTGYASKRPASHPGPYTADFGTIYLEVGNEEWGTQQVPADAEYGQWAHFVLSQAIAGKSYFNPSQIRFIADGFDLIPSFGSNAAAAAPEISVVDAALYTQGNTALSGDAYYQSDLVQVPVGNGPIIDGIAAQQKADAGNGLNYGLAAYEEGPGADTPTHTGDTTLAAAIGAIDVNLYASLNGFGPQNLFEYNLGTGPYTSHQNFANGFRPHPVWEALQMRNNYCTGPMVLTVANSVPTYSDPVITDGQAVPLIAVYTFQDANVANQADVVVLSRDLDNQTPVTLNFPATPAGSGQLYTLTGDPRQTNDDALNIPIGSQTLSGVTKSYTFTMPPGSMYIFQVPLTGTWSPVGEPVPPAPTFLTATAGSGQVVLKWTASAGATSYNVYLGTVSGGEGITQIATGVTSATYTVTGLTNEQAYFFTVTAVDGGGASGYSNEATATPLAAGSGTILAYEPFAESTGPLSGAGGGGDFGWGGAWQEQGSSTAVPGYNIASTAPLTYTGLLTNGNYGIGGYEYQGSGRLLDQDPSGPFSVYLQNGLIGAPGTTVWVSFLLRKDTSDTQENAVFLDSSDVPWYAGAPNSIAVGYFGASSNDAGGNPFWSLQYNNGTPILTNVPVVVGQTDLFVLEVTFGATNVANLYVNPTSLGGAAPATPSATYSTASNVGFDAIAYYGGDSTSPSTSDQSSLDEIRVGTSFAAVTPTFPLSPPVPAALTSPTPGSQLAGSSVTFTWTPGAGVTNYWLNLGTAATGVNSKNIFSSGPVTALAEAVTGLPTNGETIYATLYSYIDGAWQPAVYTFYATGPAVLTAPALGAKLTANATFTWTPGTGITNYWFNLGTANAGANAKNLYISGLTTELTATVTGIPQYGETLYATLYSFISGAWQPIVYTYIAVGSPVAATLTTPTPSTKLSSSSVTFTWSGSEGVTYYWFNLGTADSGAFAKNIYSSGSTALNSANVTGLPTNGEPIYATLYSYIAGAWQPTIYTYTASGSPTPALLTAPAAGTSLTSSTVTFSWSAGNPATYYWLNLGTASSGASAKNIYSGGSTTATSVTVNNLPTNGETIYATLYSYIGEAWQPTFYTYKAE